MKPRNPGSERVQARPHYCGTDPCPVDDVLGLYLAKGGCIFCRGGVCSASPLALSMFSTAARSTRPTVPCYRKAISPPLKEL
jgi:hypothetical protein